MEWDDYVKTYHDTSPCRLNFTDSGWAAESLNRQVTVTIRGYDYEIVPGIWTRFIRCRMDYQPLWWRPAGNLSWDP